MVAGHTIGDLLPNIKNRKSETRKDCCVADRTPPAPRAGTSGFRAPEVLIQCPHQTTAVDVWSAGIIFLSLLTGRYPFFEPVNDIESLAQLIAIFGTDKLKKLAHSCGKRLTASYYSSGFKLNTLVESCRRVCGQEKSAFLKPAAAPQGIKKASPSCTAMKITPPYGVSTIPSSAYDLLNGLLDVNPITRLSAAEALNHPFFKGSSTGHSVKLNKIYVSEKVK